jgi:predicted nucleic acid-binding protein
VLHDALTTNVIFHVGIRAAAHSLAAIDTSRLVTIEFAGRARHARARAWLARLSDQRLSYTDAVSFAVMEAARCRVALSFDEDFSVAGFRLWQHDG